MINSAVRLAFNLLLLQRHWLKAAERIEFKLAVLVYKCLHGTASLYLTDKLGELRCPTASSLRPIDHLCLPYTPLSRRQPVAGPRGLKMLCYLTSHTPLTSCFLQSSAYLTLQPLLFPTFQHPCWWTGPAGESGGRSKTVQDRFE